MKLRLPNHYRGVRSNMVLIPPGDYTEDTMNPTLMRYLVDTDHAEWLVKPEGEAAEALDEEALTEESFAALESLGRDELEAIAGELGIVIENIDGSGANGNVLKADLIEAIKAAQ